jgi:DNA-binding transcriptional MocR family regulator
MLLFNQFEYESTEENCTITILKVACCSPSADEGVDRDLQLRRQSPQGGRCHDNDFRERERVTTVEQRPAYQRIIDKLTDDLRCGTIREGARLPNHRDLAGQLDVSVGTVSKAYRELERVGLIVSTPGRGTFVRERGTGGDKVLAPAALRPVDLRGHRPPTQTFTIEFSVAMSRMDFGEPTSDLQNYSDSRGRERHRIGGARWIAESSRVAVTPDDVLVTNGAQHALACALLALCRNGDTVLAEEYTYAGLQSVASLLNLQIRSVPMDRDGALPDALEKLVVEHKPRVFVCIPNIQNPTTATMPIERRQAIAEVSVRHGLMVIEDDVYGRFVGEDLPALKALMPDRVILITSLSKAVAPGLRVGFIASPREHVDQLSQAIRGTAWMASPQSCEIATTWIEDGTLDRIIAANLQEFVRRNAMLSARIPPKHLHHAPTGAHAWITLPSGWTAVEFGQALAARLFLVQHGGDFHIGAGRPMEAIRVSVGGADNDQVIARFGELAAELIERHPLDRDVQP